MNENNILAQILSCHIPWFFIYFFYLIGGGVLPGFLRYLVSKQKLYLSIELGTNCGYAYLLGANDIS